MNRIQLTLLLGAVALSACTEEPLQSPDNLGVLQGNGDRITVENDPGVLAARVSLVHVALDVVPVGPQLAAMQAQGNHDMDGDVFKLFLVASVDPPMVGDITLQATHIVLRGHHAVVSYNVQGPTHAGGVDVFDIKHPDAIQLVSQTVFDDTDVSAIDLRGFDLYLAEATTDPAFTTPAVLEHMELKQGQVRGQSARVNLPSYVGTGVDAQSDLLFLTSGDLDGGLSAFDPHTLDLVYFREIPDARAVATHESEVVVMRGTPGALHIFDGPTGDLLRSFETGGANIPESKSTVEVARGKIFYAAGDEGLRVVDYLTGDVLANAPVLEVDGVDPENEVTNAVSLHGNLIFMANGGAGLQVVRANQSVEDGEGDADAAPLALQVLGHVVFPGGESANFVGGKGNLVFVANGAGGLHIIKIVRGGNDGGETD